VIISNHRFLFFLERDFHIAILKPLMEYIHKNTLGISKVYAPFSNTMAQTLRQNLSFDLEIVKDPYEWNPEITFLCDFSFQYTEGLGKLVNIGHGTISKGWYYSKNKISQRENCADLLCVPGTIHKERLQSQVYIPIAVTGIPKLDRCFNGTLKYDEIMDRFGLDPEQKTVLLAPTFNQEYSILPHLQGKDLSKIFPDFINLIVKVHGVTETKYKDIFYHLQKRRKNVYIAEGYDTDEAFFVSDLLISDVSSVIYEFLSLNKPILLYDSPTQKSYINYFETDIEWEYRKVGLRFSEIEILPRLIFNTLTSNKDISHKEIGERFISVRDGTSTERVINLAISLLSIKPEHSVTILTQYITEDMKKRFGPHLEICQSQSNIFEALHGLATHRECKYLLFIDYRYDFTPQIVKYLINQMRNNSEVRLVAPLIDDTIDHMQNLNTLIDMTKEANFINNAIKLTYSFTGQNMDIDTILPYCFILDRETLLQVEFKDLTNTNRCINEYIAHIKKKRYRVALAFDCLIQKLDPPPKINILQDPTRKDYRAIYRQIKEYEREGNIQKALQQIDELGLFSIEEPEIFVRFITLKARLHFIAQQYGEVLESINIALQCDANNVDALLIRGAYYISQAAFSQAEADFKNAITKDPQNIKALCNHALALQLLERHIESNASFVKALEVDFHNLEAINGLFKNSFYTRDFSLIKQALNKVLEVDTENTSLLFSLAGVYIENKEHSEARAVLEKILVIDSEYPGCRELLGKLIKQ